MKHKKKRRLFVFNDLSKPKTKLGKVILLAEKYEVQHEHPIKEIIEAYKESKEE